MILYSILEELANYPILFYIIIKENILMINKQVIVAKEGNFELVCNAPIYTSYTTFNGLYVRKRDNYNVGNQLILFYNIIDPVSLTILPKEQ